FGMLQVASGSTTGGTITTTEDGKVGIGTTSPEGKLNIFSATAGSVTPESTYDELVIENSDHAGIIILTPADKKGGIGFGSPTDPGRAELKYDHASDAFILRGQGAELMAVSTGNTFLNGLYVMRHNDAFSFTSETAKAYNFTIATTGGVAGFTYRIHASSARDDEADYAFALWQGQLRFRNSANAIDHHANTTTNNANANSTVALGIARADDNDITFTVTYNTAATSYGHTHIELISTGKISLT
ncbi:MAG: hypothetical protein QF535_09555, partial [Anaerolineales bacterium]|nr:hypothetical protein [Anaerolineales bacterium]